MDADLRAEQILELEFEYARDTAAQAQNDRMTIVNLYVLLVGAIGSAVIALPQLMQVKLTNLPFELDTVLFFFVGITGVFTLMKLVRLRQAWYDSARAMNKIKQYYLKYFPELDAAFLWKPDSIPPMGKLWSITFILCLLITLLDSASIALGVQSLGLHSSIGEYTPALFVAAVFFAWQWLWYFFQLPISNK